MKRINYSRIFYTTIDKISKVVFRELEKYGVSVEDIKDVGWYGYGRFSSQPLIVFLKDGRIYKVGTRKGNIYVERIK